MKSLNHLTKKLTGVLFIVCASVIATAKDNKSLQATGGSISYTLHVGNQVINVDTVLTGDSYIFTGEESDIVIADPGEKFYIGIVVKGAIGSEKITQPATEGAAYTLASYLVYDTTGKTMEAKPFDNGFVTIEATDTGSYAVNFMYILSEKYTGRQITLKGRAVFIAPHLALH